MRTTLTLDPDVASRLKAEVRRSGRPFKEVVNEALRLAFTKRSRGPVEVSRFEIRSRDMGALRPGLSLDNIGALLESAEGPTHR